MVEGFKKGFYTTSQKQERKPETSILDHTSSFNQSSSQYINEFQNLQEENHRLSKKQIEIEEKISDLIQNNKSLKQEKDIIKTEKIDRSLLQSVNIRFEQMEMKLNQFANLTENIFLINVPLNDPMDVEPDFQPEKMHMKKKKNNAAIVEKSDISQDTVEVLKENKNLKGKIFEET